MVAVFDNLVKIFKASTGDLLQTLGQLDKRSNQTSKFRFKTSSMNPLESEIILLANNTKEAKNTVQSEIYVMREITYEEQVDGLLGQGRIDEAREVFLTRGPKTELNYMQKFKMFHLDAGWQLLNTGRPKEILNWFKNTDVDPRELLLLFKDLTTNSQALMDHLKS